MNDLDTALKHLPAKPGVYRMYNAKGQIIYIGKAKSLKNRVKSYFQTGPGTQHTPKVQLMIGQIARFDFIVTDSEVEAFLLESNMIKAEQPRYNILLRDDKKFPWLGISDEPFPRLFITRSPVKSTKTKAQFFGPYTNAGELYETLRMLRKHFPMRQRRTPLFKNRPCMNYFIGTCPGPCQQLIPLADYDETVRQVILFLKGKSDELESRIQAAMQAASEAMNFEWAAKLRDRLAVVQALGQSRQKMLSVDTDLNVDVLAMASDELRCVMTVMQIRQGKLIGTTSRELLRRHKEAPEELYTWFLAEYYREQPVEDWPNELILQLDPQKKPETTESFSIFLAWQATQSPRKWHRTVPQKGLKKELLQLAQQNATETLNQLKYQDSSRLRTNPTEVLLALQEALDLPEYPARLECYDISHVQGTNTVASMVVFEEGTPNKAEYRRFNIRSVAEGKPDDFASMAEVMRRRFAQQDWPMPDLMIIDGGKGQLSAAMAALDAVAQANPEITIPPVVSLAKKFEEIFVPAKSHHTKSRPEKSRCIILPRSSPVLFLLQQIRDEAHRFAITFHRQKRGKAAKISVLDNIAGLGPKRKINLLKAFGTIEAIQASSLKDFSAVLGLKPQAAQAMWQALQALQKTP